MIKNISKTGFRFILSLSLVFTPSLSYSQQSAGGHDAPEDAIQKILKTLEEEHSGRDISPAVQEAARILEEIGVAFEENRLANYIDSKPKLKQKIDVFSLGNQEVQVLNYKKEIKYGIAFDTGNNTFQPYDRELVDIEVDFNSEGKLILKGVVVSENTDHNLKKKIGLIHTFNNMEQTDVIDWSYDKEFLVILHQKRGLVLYHTVIARKLLGSAPIPSLSLPVSQDLLNLLKNTESVKLEFIDSSILPPALELEEGRARDKGVQFNLAGKPMFTAGDLLVSRTDSEGNKHIVQVISRQDFTVAKNNMYRALYHLVQIKNVNTEDVQKLSAFPHLQIILSATFNRKPVAFFSAFAEKFFNDIHIMFLTYRTQEKESDKFTLEGWRNTYQQIIETNPELVNNRSRNEGKIPSSEDIAKAINPKDLPAFSGEEQTHFLQWLKIPPKTVEFLKKEYGIDIDRISETLEGHKGNIFAILGFLFWVGWYSSVSPSLGWSSDYFPSVIQNIVVLGVVFLLVTYLIGRWSIPALKHVVHPFLQFVANRFSGNFKTQSEEILLTIEQKIEKWGKKDISSQKKVVALGFLVLASIMPIFEAIFKVVGYKHLFDALRLGINPAQKITPESRLGTDFKLNQPLRVGLGWSSWLESREKSQKRAQIINALEARKNRVDRLSGLMTYYALTNQPTFDLKGLLTGPESVLGGIIINYYAEKVRDNKTKILNVLWVSRKLSEYISKSNFDADRSIQEWDVTRIQSDFYQRALDLAQEVQSVSWTQRKIRGFMPLVKKSFRHLLSVNTEPARILRAYFPENTMVDQFWLGLIMDHILLVIAPLTPATLRGDTSFAQLANRAVESYRLPNSSSQHLFEAHWNVVMHTFFTARQQLQYLTLGQYETLREVYKSVAQLYDPVSKYFSPTKNTAYPRAYFTDWFSFPFQWGRRIYDGDNTREERVDIGYQAYKNFVLLAWRFWIVTIPLAVLARKFFVEPENSIWFHLQGMIYFATVGVLLLGIPQLWVMWHNSMFAKKGEERKAIIDHIKLVLNRMENRNYESFSQLNEDYKKALLGFKKLFDFSKKFREESSSMINTLDPKFRALLLRDNFEEKESPLEIMERELLKIIKTQTIEDKIEQMRAIRSNLDTRYLPTEGNIGALASLTLLWLGIYSNIAFPYISVRSFESFHWGYDTVMGVMIFLGLGLVYKFLSGHSLRDHLRGESLKDTKGGRIVRRTYNQLQNQLQKTKNRCISAFKRYRE